MTQRDIERAVLDVAWAIDTGDLAGLAAMLDDDIEMVLGARSARGRSAVVELFRSALAQYASVSHHVSNVCVTLESDARAVVRSYVHAFHERARGSAVYEAWGTYQDIYVLAGRRWTLRHRHFVARGRRDLGAVDLGAGERTGPDAYPAGSAPADRQHQPAGGATCRRSDMQDARVIGAAFFEAWGSDDIDRMCSLFSDDVVFTSPVMEIRGRERYREALVGFAEVKRSLVVHKQFVDGNDVTTWFRMETQSGTIDPIVNWIVVDGGKVATVRAVFDPRSL